MSGGESESEHLEEETSEVANSGHLHVPKDASAESLSERSDKSPSEKKKHKKKSKHRKDGLKDSNKDNPTAKSEKKDKMKGGTIIVQRPSPKEKQLKRTNSWRSEKEKEEGSVANLLMVRKQGRERASTLNASGPPVIDDVPPAPSPPADDKPAKTSVDKLKGMGRTKSFRSSMSVRVQPKTTRPTATEVFAAPNGGAGGAGGGGSGVLEVKTSNSTFQDLMRKKEARDREVMSVDPSLPERLLKRNKVLNELINTERDYIRDLEVLIREFKVPLEAGVLDRNEVQAVFSNVTTLVGLNKSLFAEMQKGTEDMDHVMVGRAFLGMVMALKMYSTYCANQSTGRQTVTRLMADNPKFKEHCEATQRDKGYQIKDFLIKPVQRLCKYPLLLRELIKYTEPDAPDMSNLRESFEKIEEVVSVVNQRRQDEEDREAIASILQSLSGTERFHLPLMVPGRKFVREGMVFQLQKNADPLSLKFFAFNDLLVLALRSIVAPSTPSSTASKQDSSSLNAQGGNKKDRRGTTVKPTFVITAQAMIILAGIAVDEPTNKEVVIRDQNEEWVLRFETAQEKREFAEYLRGGVGGNTLKTFRQDERDGGPSSES